MILYHGSYTKVETPDLKHSRNNVDFGAGFYVTPIYEQSLKWSLKFKKRGKDSFISSFEFTQDKLSSLNVMKFDDYSDSWLDFILDAEADRTQVTMILLSVALPMTKFLTQ